MKHIATNNIQHFQTISSEMGVWLAALRAGHALPPERFLVLISVTC
jgi:hypothetical protein